MIGNAHDVPDDYRRRKRHLVRQFYKKAGLYTLAHRHRRRALRKTLRQLAFIAST